MDKNLYDLPPEELKDIPTVCGSLREALTELQQNDHAFLLKGDVFNRDFIESYIELKWEEVYAFEHTPAPDRVPDVLLGLTKTLVDVRSPRGGADRPRVSLVKSASAAQERLPR